MRTETMKEIRGRDQLADDVAAASALRQAWRRGGSTERRSKATKATAASSHDADGDRPCSCDDCVAHPSAGELVNSAWFEELATTLRAQAQAIESELARGRALVNSIADPERRERERAAVREMTQGYETLARELRVAAVRAERQAETEHALIRESVTGASFALVG